MQGKRAKNNGKMFEQLIESACKVYRNQGRANINKTPEPLKPIGVLRGGQFRAVYDKRGQPDFLGTLAGGKSIMIEAKHTSSTNLRFDSVLRHQARQLALTDILGGIAGILVSFSMERFYYIPYKVWETLENNLGKKSFNEKDVASYAVNTKNGFIDFLQGVE